MKTIIKILFAASMIMIVSAADAQYRRYYPRNSRPMYQDRVGKNGEIIKDQNRYSRRSNQPTKLHLNLNYAISQPLGGLKDYAGKTSLNGWHLSLLYAINPKWQIGLGAGFYDYYERFPRKVYHNGNIDISAVQTHTMQLIPIQPTVLYFPGEEEQAVKPYVGIGLGATVVGYKNYWGEFLDKDNSIGFSASPMAGIRISFSKTSPLECNADVRYNFVPYSKHDINGIHTVEANVGLSLNIR